MTCLDCLHYEVCHFTDKEVCRGTRVKDLEIDGILNSCKDFKNKSCYIEQKHGVWRRKQSVYSQSGHILICSCCKEQIESLSGNLRYCPNCGALMDGKEAT